MNLNIPVIHDDPGNSAPIEPVTEDHQAPEIRRAILMISLAFAFSFVIYLMTLVRPYSLFTYVSSTPISLSQIVNRHPRAAGIFVLSFLILFGLYWMAYRECRRCPSRKLIPWILAYGLILALLLCPTFPIGASDVVDYVGHGEVLAFHNINPLVDPPATVPDTNLVQYAPYRREASPYGPLWTWIGGVTVGIAGRESLLLNLLGFKIVAVGGHMAQALVIYAFFRRRGRDPAQAPAALLFFAWNPLLLYEFAVNGHNDAAMMVFALLGILLWDANRPLLMVTALTLSFLIKIPTAPLLPLFLLSAARQNKSSRGLWSTLLRGGAVALGVMVLLYLSLPDPWSGPANISKRSVLFTHSLPTVIKLVLQLGGVSKSLAMRIVRTATLFALGICYSVQMARVLKVPKAALVSAYKFVLFFLLFAVPWFQPWYVTWLVSLAALIPDAGTRSQTGLFSFTVMLSYIVYGFVWYWITPIANWGGYLGIHLMSVAVTFVAPWVYAALLWAGKQSSED